MKNNQPEQEEKPFKKLFEDGDGYVGVDDAFKALAEKWRIKRSQKVVKSNEKAGNLPNLDDNSEIIQSTQTKQK